LYEREPNRIKVGLAKDTSVKFSSLRSIRHFIRTNEGQGQAHSPKLPSRAQFHSLIESVRVVNKRFSHDAADLIEFLAYGGYRKAEAKNICWSDCNFEKGEILVRGDEKTGTKNWTVRTVPMIPGMRKLLERLKAERPGEPARPRRSCRFQNAALH
jgi:integrase